MADNKLKKLFAEKMTAAQMKKARKRLGYSLVQMGRAMGYRGPYAINSQWKIENSNAPISKNKTSLVEAFLSGWRPHDWPEGWK